MSIDQRRDADVRRLMVVALVALTLFLPLAVWARFSSPAPWEPGLMATIALGAGSFDALVSAINTLGNLPVWIVLVTVIAAIGGYLRGLSVAVLIVLTLAADLAAFGVKLVVERQRPETAAVDHFFGPDSFAFPSGHVIRAVALVAVLTYVFAPARWRLPLALVGALVAGLAMGYARVALGVHWPTDALGGLLLGVAWFALTTLVVIRSSSTIRYRRDR